MVVGCSVDLDPVGFVDAAAISSRREGRSDLDPATLLVSDEADLLCDLRKVLVFAEEYRYVVFLAGARRMMSTAMRTSIPFSTA